MAKKKEIEVHFEHRWVEMPPEHEAMWWEGIRVIVELVCEEAISRRRGKPEFGESINGEKKRIGS